MRPIGLPWRGVPAHARDAAQLQPLDGVLGPRSAVDHVADPEQPVVRGVEAQGLERFLERVEVPVQVSGDQIASALGVRLVVHDRLGRPDPLHASTVRGHCESSQRLRCIFRISSITAQTSTDKRERRHLGRERENHGIMLLDAECYSTPTRPSSTGCNLSARRRGPTSCRSKSLRTGGPPRSTLHRGLQGPECLRRLRRDRAIRPASRCP